MSLIFFTVYDGNFFICVLVYGSTVYIICIYEYDEWPSLLLKNNPLLKTFVNFCQVSIVDGYHTRTHL
jgi:hypothetical protein